MWAVLPLGKDMFAFCRLAAGPLRRKCCKAREQFDSVACEDGAPLFAVQFGACLDLVTARDSKIPAQIGIVGAKEHLAHPGNGTQHVQVCRMPGKRCIPLEPAERIGRRTALLRTRDYVHLVDDENRVAKNCAAGV